ncbi:AfsR/SARP family transcriptional regulator [Kitasatospora cheerisanensis]|uniref:AfsR family transcriptional regulator n=1 Tax=Kitasatospora cheerisanensis KCTC 2395 TaxID=1348663 RepID=A0A066YVQ4_9ACTN|nr:BTAD domain-containing putative transcriptional regulator [Kitasatospora cheerisanensis]KDN82161.1 AfsR family transcriptional regulator [Kitasatospora cheerisanensis KCTC 2395]
MKFRLLGAVSAENARGEDMRLGPEKRRSVLALLLLRRNRAVSVAQLIEALWVAEPPANARTVVQSHISRLRALLSEQGATGRGVQLATAGDAYTLHLPEGQLDVEQFDTLVAAARLEARSLDVVDALEHALALWRGPALTGTVASPPLEAWRQTLEENRLAAVEALAEHYQRLGEPARAAELLRAETVAHPLRESLVSALMLALFRAGRQSDALDWYHRTRESLADRLGVDPGRALNAAYERILRGEPAEQPAPTAAPAPAAVAPSPAPPSSPAPAAAVAWVLPSPAGPPAIENLPAVDLLPRAPRGFHGREAELATLADAVHGGPDGAIALITGPAGVGKTALALHWAHRNAGRFPDGLLFADLGGFSDRPDRELDEVIAEFLAALGVAREDLPAGTAARAALYRRITTGRRLLVVVDNARDTAQVRPLLPAGTDSVAVVTSRHRMLGLVAAELARPLPLSVLGPVESAALLARVLGPARVAAEPDAARELARLCDGLPLALRIAAAKISADPRRGLGAITEQLRHEQRRLGHLAAEEISVASALRVSYEQLPPAPARLFRALGFHPGPVVDAHTAAALGDLEPTAAAEALEQLAATHLVTETDGDRYTLHDLVWLYARELAGRAEPAEQRLARERLADQYLHTGLAAAQAAEPGSKPCCEPPAGSHQPRAVTEFATADDAIHWLGAHRETLAQVIATASPERVWRLVLTQWPLILRRLRDGWVSQLEHALDATLECGDLDGESQVRAMLGWVLVSNRRLPEAVTCLSPAAELAGRAGNQVGRAVALVNLAAVQAELGDTGAAGSNLTQALEIALSIGHTHTVTLALQHLARHLLDTGRPTQAIERSLHGLELMADQIPSSRRVLLHTTCGEALTALGRHAEARSRLTAALTEAEQIGHDEATAEVLAALAAAEDAAGLATAATAHRRRAEELGPR